MCQTLNLIYRACKVFSYYPTYNNYAWWYIIWNLSLIVTQDTFTMSRSSINLVKTLVYAKEILKYNLRSLYYINMNSVQLICYFAVTQDKLQIFFRDQLRKNAHGRLWTWQCLKLEIKQISSYIFRLQVNLTLLKTLMS